MLKLEQRLPQTPVEAPLYAGRLSTGRIVVDVTSPAERLEARDQAEWVNTKVQLYKADSYLIPDIAEAQGIELNQIITDTLKGESQINDNHAAGLGRATIELGKVINGIDGKDFLFKGRMPEGADPTGHRPAGEAADLFLRMLGDVMHPYEPTRGDGYAVLKARAPHRAYKTGRYGHNYMEATAHMCSNSESHFMRGLLSEHDLEPIEVDGQVVALQKRQGDHTALLVKPAILNGVRLPVGSIMTVERSREGDYSFAFGRLSAFVFSDVKTINRELAPIVTYERLDSEQASSFKQALEIFNALIERHPQPRGDLDAESRLSRMLKRLDLEAQAVAEQAMQDRRDQQAGRNPHNTRGIDPGNRLPLKQAYTRWRMELLRTFGGPAIAQARATLDNS